MSNQEGMRPVEESLARARDKAREQNNLAGWRLFMSRQKAELKARTTRKIYIALVIMGLLGVLVYCIIAMLQTANSYSATSWSTTLVPETSLAFPAFYLCVPDQVVNRNVEIFQCVVKDNFFAQGRDEDLPGVCEVTAVADADNLACNFVTTKAPAISANSVLEIGVYLKPAPLTIEAIGIAASYKFERRLPSNWMVVENGKFTLVTMDHLLRTHLDGRKDESIIWTQASAPFNSPKEGEPGYHPALAHTATIAFRFNDLQTFNAVEFVAYDYLWLIGAVGGAVSLFRILEVFGRKADVVARGGEDVTLLGTEEEEMTPVAPVHSQHSSSNLTHRTGSAADPGSTGQPPADLPPLRPNSGDPDQWTVHDLPS